MNIYDSLMDIFDPKKQKHLCRNIASCASPTPKGVIYGHSKNNLWTFMTHWWTFLTKKNKDIYVEKQRHLGRKKDIYDETAKYYYITLPFNIVILAHLIRNTLPSITIILFHHTNSTFLSTKSLLINSTKLID